MIWGLEVAGDSGRLRGTFINADHLAFYLILAIAVTLAWLWWSARDLWSSGRVERHLLLTVAPGLLFLTLFAGVAFTGSRAGLVAMVLTILFQALLLAVHYRRWQVGLLAASAVALGAGGLAMFGLRQGLDRWLSTSAFELTWNSRYTVYRAGSLPPPVHGLPAGTPIGGSGGGSRRAGGGHRSPAPLAGRLFPDVAGQRLYVGHRLRSGQRRSDGPAAPYQAMILRRRRFFSDHSSVE